MSAIDICGLWPQRCNFYAIRACACAHAEDNGVGAEKILGSVPSNRGQAPAPASPPPAADAEVAGLSKAGNALADKIDRLTAELAHTAGALDVALASELRLAATLADARKWRKCDTHGDVDGARQWGCPDCVAELRATLAGRTAERDKYRTALEKVARYCSPTETVGYNREVDEVCLAALRAKDEPPPPKPQTWQEDH